MMIPSTMQEYSKNGNYILVFNKNTNEYNELPKENGAFNIYVAIYDKNKNILIIEKFIYNYKN